MRLAAARIGCQGDEVKDQGVGRQRARRPAARAAPFPAALRDCPGAADLQPGDVVTTGTWTDAYPIEPGQVWQSQFDPPLHGLELRCER